MAEAEAALPAPVPESVDATDVSTHADAAMPDVDAASPEAGTTTFVADPPAAPPGVIGKRERKRPVKFEAGGPGSGAPKKRERREGTGVPLGQIPNVAFLIGAGKAKDDEMVTLHRLCFGVPGALPKRKEDIRGFRGFAFRSDKDRKTLRTRMGKENNSVLKKMAKLLDVPLSGGSSAHKADVIEELIQFLEDPKLPGEDRENLEEKVKRLKGDRDKKREQLKGRKEMAKSNAKVRMKKKEENWNDTDSESEMDDDEGVVSRAASKEMAEEKLKRSVKAGRVEKSGSDGKVEKAGKVGKAGKAGKVVKTEKSGERWKSTKATKGENGGKAGKAGIKRTNGKLSTSSDDEIASGEIEMSAEDEDDEEEGSEGDGDDESDSEEEEGEEDGEDDGDEEGSHKGSEVSEGEVAKGSEKEKKDGRASKPPAKKARKDKVDDDAKPEDGGPSNNELRKGMRDLFRERNVEDFTARDLRTRLEVKFMCKLESRMAFLRMEMSKVVKEKEKAEKAAERKSAGEKAKSMTNRL